MRQHQRSPPVLYAAGGWTKGGTSVGGKFFWAFKPVEGAVKAAELLLYGEIAASSWWGDEVTPKQFAADLKGLGDVSLINVRINSPGGDVFAGQAIHSMLKRHPATINVYVDGLAASAASIVAMAGDRVLMPQNAVMMIHDPWTIVVGNADDMRKAAADLDKIREPVISAYEAKTGLSRDRIGEMLAAETWMTAEEAVELGFADAVEENKKITASLCGRTLLVNGQEFDISRYRSLPRIGNEEKETAPRKTAMGAAEKRKWRRWINYAWSMEN